MNKHEVKYQNSARKMQQALLVLIERKHFSEIPIKDICDIAGLNRSTFYAHYNNTYELLKETETEVIANFYKDFEVEFGLELKQKDLNLSNGELLDSKILLPFLRLIKKNKKLFKVFSENKLLFNLYDHFTIFKNSIFKIAYKNMSEISNEDIEYVSMYYLTGVHSIIECWVNNNCKEDEEKICRLIRLCVLNTL